MTYQPRRGDWLFPVLGTCSFTSGWFVVTPLLLRVPAFTRQLECTESPLPASTLWVVFVSNWYIRILPFLILLGFLAIPVIAVLLFLAARIGRALLFIRPLGLVALTLGVAEGVLCAYVLYGMKAAA